MMDANDLHENKSYGFRHKLLGFLAAAAVLVASLGAVETLSQRRRQLEKMSAEQCEDLLRNEHDFRALSPQDQQRIRDLHDQIESAPDREKLRATMNRYCKWFETQPFFRRAKLLDKKTTTADRIAKVKELLKKPGPTKDIHLDDRNRRFLAAWLDRYIAEHGARFIDDMAKANPRIAKFPPDRQQAILRENLLRRWQMGGPNGQLPIAGHEMMRLRAGLSPELKAKLAAKEPAEQDRIIAEWLRETATQELDEQLAGFFEGPEISDLQRDLLMSLPSEKMYESLRDLYSTYLERSKSAEPPRGDRPPRSHDHRPGGAPKGSGAWHRPEDRDEKGPRAGRDFKDTQGLSVRGFTAEKSPVEKHGSERASPGKPADEKSAAKKPGEERGTTEH
ncbi:MAG: hypothetical protein ABSG53_01010 [Thermoguttaceae bacterium]|jgi:hypothetical protein